MQFKHFPHGSVIGTGAYVFRHFGNESPYEDYTPLDTNRFPTTLSGMYAESLTGSASGASSTYIGSVFAKPWLTQNARKLGRCYSSIGNYVSSFSDYRKGDLAIGYSVDSATSENKALNVWCFDYKPTAAEANAWIDLQNSTILYELFESDESAWKSVTRKSDGVHGYLCTVKGTLGTSANVGTFVEVKNMDAPARLMMGGNPFYPPTPEPDEPEEGDDE